MGHHITPDFTEAVEFQPLPAGTYKARITEVKVKQSKAGNPLLDWTLTTFGNSANNNSKIWHTTPITGKGAGILKSFLRAATGEEPAQKPFDTDDYMGKTVLVTVEDGIDLEGKPTGFPRVKAVAKATE